MKTGQPVDPETTTQMNTLGRKYRDYITLLFDFKTVTHPNIWGSTVPGERG